MTNGSLEIQRLTAGFAGVKTAECATMSTVWAQSGLSLVYTLSQFESNSQCCSRDLLELRRQVTEVNSSSSRRRRRTRNEASYIQCANTVAGLAWKAKAKTALQ